MCGIHFCHDRSLLKCHSVLFIIGKNASINFIAVDVVLHIMIVQSCFKQYVLLLHFDGGFMLISISYLN